MAKDKFVTLSLFKKYDALKTPPIQYVESLPTEKVENGIYAIKHEGTETKTVNTRFTDILYSYFTEESKGKWTINEGYSLVIEGNTFKSVALVSDQYFIYANPDYTEMYQSSYLPQSTYEFTVLEDISHIDFYAGKAEDGSFVKLANVDEVERYFIRVEEKGAANGVASLDINGKVPVEQLPTEALVFKGYWKPSSGSYPPDGTVAGDFYIVEEEGDFDNIHWNVNDWLIWDGTKWTRSENHNDVTSVNGKKGVVKVYGDNTEIETPTETSNKRTIKEYIDDITVDDESKDENGNYTSKAVIKVTELPKPLNNKVYVKDNSVKTQYSDNGHFTKEMFFNIGTTGNTSPLKNIYKNDRDFFNIDYLIPLSDNAVITEIHINNTVYYLDTTNGSYKVFDGGPYGGYTRPNKEIKLGFGDDTIKFTFPTEDGQVIYDLTVNVTDDAYLVVEDITLTNTKEVYAKNIKLVTEAENKNNIKSVNNKTPDEDGAVIIDGDNINVKVEENAETLNTVLNRFNGEFGKTKTVDENEPDENGNTISKAVIDVTELPETVDDKVYIKSDKTVYAKDTKLVTQDEFDKDAVKTVNTIKPTNGNVQTVVPITKAEYKALVNADADDPNVVYAVYDEQSSVDIINDFKIAENLTWSSSKIQSVITAATPIVFDDSKVSTTMGWTSNKIKNEIDAKSGIDDTTTSTTSSWSSNKTSSEIATATTDMATQTWVSSTFEPVNADLLTKTTADTLYQPIGDYATKTDVSTATTDMATQSWASNTFEPKNVDLLTKTNADTLYEPKNADILTKTTADTLYEPKNDDIATKTWVGQQGYITDDTNYVKHSEVYVQNGILYINL